MSRNYVDFHVIQTVPPSNINRDDTGSPKTALYGGVTRARVSSQAWKRATRTHFDASLDRSDLGVRTKRLVELVSDAIEATHPEFGEEERNDVAAKVVAAAGIKITKPRKGEGPAEAGYLVFLSNQQVEALAELAVEVLQAGGDVAPDKKKAARAIKEQNSIDLALFGRMVADVANLNVDASAQVAHALSVHAVDNEFDYFTAVDDHKASDEEEDAGAGMIGTVEFNSSTLYRYATVNVDQLALSLGDEAAVRRALEAFARSFATSLPTGKQNTFANRTLPDAVVVTVRDDQPVNWVGAFETPIDGPGRIGAAARALADHAQAVEAAFGSGRTQTWVVRVGAATAALDELGDSVSFDEMVSSVAGAVQVNIGPAR